MAEVAIEQPVIDTSFIVAAYNVAPFIEMAVRSALAQQGVSVEVIVVDDCSSDETAAIVARMQKADPRVVLLCQPYRNGPGAARNAAIEKARGEWIAILDGDDLIAADRTRQLLDCAVATSADLIGDNFERVTEDGTPTGQKMFEAGDERFLYWVDPAAFIKGNEMLGRGQRSLGAVKIMARRAFLAEHAVTHMEQVPVGEDYHFILSALLAGARFCVTSTAGYKYRVRRGSQSWRLSEQNVGHLLDAHAETVAAAERSGDARFKAAAASYGRALTRSRDFVRTVTKLQNGDWAGGLSLAVTHPRTWPLVLRFGSQALLNRIRRRSLRPSQA